ncbi:helix-turn-helix domain-containing protein [Leuconostoc mesenteroides]|uniref:helix-turn-helix domain-containing protein n=1 Tax=Leuconostoc mesenteroides TaxID=1245 RepID=UPI00235F411C|nr:helix-turn-helix transcriptional regulator [Leuconostoc mesenteroides]
MNRLKELRLEKGNTLSETVTELGKLGLKITPTALSRYEKWPNKGGRNPSFETWVTLADYYDVPLNELMNMDDINKKVSNIVDTFRKSNDRMLSAQLDRISKTKFRDFESLNIAYAVQMVLDMYDRYDDDSDELTNITVILHALVSMINNSLGDDDDYQDTIDTFTKLVNNLKAQNKKASDD